MRIAQLPEQRVQRPCVRGIRATADTSIAMVTESAASSPLRAWGKREMRNQNLAHVGAALLIVGLFTPIVSMPIVGNVSLFNNGSNISAMVLLLLAVGAAVLAAKGLEQDVLWPGSGASAILIYAFGRLQYGLSEMRESVTKELAGNPFAGIAQAAVGTVQVQWGWLVLATGAGLLVYSGLVARRESAESKVRSSTGTARLVAGASVFLLVVAVGWDLIGRGDTTQPARAAISPVDSVASSTSTDAPQGPSREEASYIGEHLQLYDLEAKYFDSILDGQVPGVTFKLKNTGNRTLNEVEVRVEFMDENGQAIAEEEYHPVLVSEYNVSGDNTPLRPNYIWQGEPDQFYSAKSVPSEWAEGKARAIITDIEFAPGQAAR